MSLLSVTQLSRPSVPCWCSDTEVIESSIPPHLKTLLQYEDVTDYNEYQALVYVLTGSCLPFPASMSSELLFSSLVRVLSNLGPLSALGATSLVSRPSLSFSLGIT